MSNKKEESTQRIDQELSDTLQAVRARINFLIDVVPECEIMSPEGRDGLSYILQDLDATIEEAVNKHRGRT